MHYSEDTTLTISVIDCLVKVLRSWKKIIVITLIITVLSACFGAFGVWTKEKKKIEEEEEMGLLRENPEQITEIREEKIVDARSKLTVAEAEEVERLIAQLNSYVDYRRMLQEDFSSYASFYTDDAGDAVLKRTSYILKSSMEGAENLFYFFSCIESGCLAKVSVRIRSLRWLWMFSKMPCTVIRWNWINISGIE